jgi:hypothetical protein
MRTTRPALFRGRHFQDHVIVLPRSAGKEIPLNCWRKRAHSVDGACRDLWAIGGCKGCYRQAPRKWLTIQFPHPISELPSRTELMSSVNFPRDRRNTTTNSDLSLMKETFPTERRLSCVVQKNKNPYGARESLGALSQIRFV